MKIFKYFYKLFEVFGGLLLCRFLSRNHPKVLMYHRVTPEGCCGSISVDNFRKQMELLKKKFNPISVEELKKLATNDLILKNPVVVTFDDGYADLFKYAYPILRELNIPAALFVTTGFVDGDVWLWPDQIRYALERNEGNVSSYCFKSKEFDLNCDTDTAWGEIADYCLTVSNREKLELISELYRQLELSIPPNAPENYQPLTWEEISIMNKSGLDVGSHSHSHPVMAKLDDDDLLEEICKSKSIIESKLGIDVETFCYPNGQSVDFDERVKFNLKKSLYRFAFVAYPGANPLDNLLEINRYPVGNNWKEYVKTVSGFKYLMLRLGWASS